MFLDANCTCLLRQVVLFNLIAEPMVRTWGLPSQRRSDCIRHEGDKRSFRLTPCAMWERSQLFLLDPMSKGKFFSPNRCFPTKENLPSSPLTLVHSTLLDGIIELSLWGSLGMLQNSQCCTTIPCYLRF